EADAVDALQRTTHGETCWRPVQVDVGPCESEQLTQPEAERERDGECGAETVVIEGSEEQLGLVGCHGPTFGRSDLHAVGDLRNVPGHEALAFGPTKGASQHRACRTAGVRS